jgi:hypothetical protein
VESLSSIFFLHYILKVKKENLIAKKESAISTSTSHGFIHPENMGTKMKKKNHIQ